MSHFNLGMQLASTVYNEVDSVIGSSHNCVTTNAIMFVFCGLIVSDTISFPTQDWR